MRVGFLHGERHLPVGHPHRRGHFCAGGVPHFQLLVGQHGLSRRIAQQKILSRRIRLRREITRDGEHKAQRFTARIGRRTFGQRETMLQAAGCVVKPLDQTRNAECGMRSGGWGASYLHALAADFEFVRWHGDLRRSIAKTVQTPGHLMRGFAAPNLKRNPSRVNVLRRP